MERNHSSLDDQIKNRFFNLAGDNSEEATPDPIPNSEVKLFCVDGTAWVTVWESRTSPAFFYFLRHLLRRLRCRRRSRTSVRSLRRRLGSSNLLEEHKKRNQSFSVRGLRCAHPRLISNAPSGRFLILGVTLRSVRGLRYAPPG